MGQNRHFQPTSISTTTTLIGMNSMLNDRKEVTQEDVLVRIILTGVEEKL